MSTRSSIAIQNDDGSVTGIYCHSDGYIDGVGYNLIKNFTTEKEVKELIMLGDLSFIDGQSACAYHRDRGEAWKGVQPTVCDNFTKFKEKMSQEYDYLFVDNEWKVSVVYGDNPKLQLVSDLS